MKRRWVYGFVILILMTGGIGVFFGIQRFTTAHVLENQDGCCCSTTPKTSKKEKLGNPPYVSVDTWFSSYSSGSCGGDPEPCSCKKTACGCGNQNSSGNNPCGNQTKPYPCPKGNDCHHKHGSKCSCTRNTTRICKNSSSSACSGKKNRSCSNGDL